MAARGESTVLQLSLERGPAWKAVFERERVLHGAQYGRFVAGMNSRQPVERLRLLNGNQTHKPVIEWVVADLDTHRNRKSITAVRDSKSLADELLSVGEARQKAGGDVTKLDINLARNEQALADSEILVASSGATRARADLAAVLGLKVEGVASVTGNLADQTLFETMTTATERSDLAARRDEVTAAGAQVRVADAERWPSLSFRITYAHEDQGADILRGGLALSLPLFNRGQGERIAARARRERTRIELTALENTIGTESDAARASFTAAVAALEILDKRALPLAAENEQLAQESYRAGKLDLPALLVIRRDALATRATHLDRLRDAALAGVALAVALQTLR